MGHCLFMRKGETHTAPKIPGILASDLAVGSVVKLMEDGVATDYMVVNHGIPSGSSLYDASCDGMWLLRKDIKEERQWHSSDVNDYENSDIHAWLNGDFFNQFGYIEQLVIKQVKIPYRAGSGYEKTVTSGTNGLSAKIFLLSTAEIGFSTSNNAFVIDDGDRLTYFIESSDGNSLRIAYLNGLETKWFLRSPYCKSSYGAKQTWYVATGGNCATYYCSAQFGVRPALILPSNAVFDETTMLLKGVA